MIDANLFYILGTDLVVTVVLVVLVKHIGKLKRDLEVMTWERDSEAAWAKEYFELWKARVDQEVETNGRQD